MKSKTKPLFLFLFSLPLLTSEFVSAAACCGGGFAAPSLIVGDEKAQITTSYAYSEIVADVGTDSLWRKRRDIETGETFKVDAAHIFHDRWQFGASIPILRRSREAESTTGLGDISTTVGYEFLPDWNYNPWRPRGHVFFQITLPTGKSINESDSFYQLESRGRGYWAIGAGTILTKNIENWDAFAKLDAHRSFDQDYENSQSRGTLHPGYGGNMGVGCGFNQNNFRIGVSLVSTYEDAVGVSGTTPSKGSAQRQSSASLSASYLFKREFAATITYTDQTLVGSPTNTSLERITTLNFQKRWLR